MSSILHYKKTRRDDKFVVEALYLSGKNIATTIFFKFHLFK